MTYYELLSVPPTATTEAIRTARDSLIRRNDPATFKGDRLIALYKIKRINDAYAVLSNPILRQAYDLTLQRSKNPKT